MIGSQLNPGVAHHLSEWDRKPRFVKHFGRIGGRENPDAGKR
jgi:hypothetical protein